MSRREAALRVVAMARAASLVSRRATTARLAAEIGRLAELGMCAAEISAALGLSKKSIWHRAKLAGIALPRAVLLSTPAHLRDDPGEIVRACAALGMTVHETADELGLSLGGTRHHARRAGVRLRPEPGGIIIRPRALVDSVALKVRGVA